MIVLYIKLYILYHLKEICHGKILIKSSNIKYNRKLIENIYKNNDMKNYEISKTYIA